MSADHAPTPYSAVEIREATPTGSQLRFLVGAPGAQALNQIMTFTQPTAEDVEVMVEMQTDRGEPLGEPSNGAAGRSSFE